MQLKAPTKSAGLQSCGCLWHCAVACAVPCCRSPTSASSASPCRTPDCSAAAAANRNQLKLSWCPALQEYQFRGIEKSEWNNLFSFIQAKRLRIENVDEAKQGPAGPNRAAALLEDLGDDDEIDPGGSLAGQQGMPRSRRHQHEQRGQCQFSTCKGMTGLGRACIGSSPCHMLGPMTKLLHVC